MALESVINSDYGLNYKAKGGNVEIKNIDNGISKNIDSYANQYQNGEVEEMDFNLQDFDDFDINRIKTKEIRINTVSGDVDISYIEADKAIFDTISGDIDVCGKLKLKRGSSISGSINYKAVN